MGCKSSKSVVSSDKTNHHATRPENLKNLYADENDSENDDGDDQFESLNVSGHTNIIVASPIPAVGNSHHSSRRAASVTRTSPFFHDNSDHNSHFQQQRSTPERLFVHEHGRSGARTPRDIVSAHHHQHHNQHHGSSTDRAEVREDKGGTKQKKNLGAFTGSAMKGDDDQYVSPPAQPGTLSSRKTTFVVDRSHILGRGGNAVVFRGTMKIQHFVTDQDHYLNEKDEYDSSVLQARRMVKEVHHPVAVKEISVAGREEDVNPHHHHKFQELLNEFRQLQKLHSPHIIRVLYLQMGTDIDRHDSHRMGDSSQRSTRHRSHSMINCRQQTPPKGTTNPSDNTSSPHTIARIYMEFAQHGTLREVMRLRGKGEGAPSSTGRHGGKGNFRLHEAEIRAYMVQALKGLAFLHAKKIVHRDLKPHNMLVDQLYRLSPGNENQRQPPVLKLSDFGTVKDTLVGGVCQTTNTIVGTAPYLSPEAVRGKFSFASDVWAFAISFVQLATTGNRTWKHLEDDIVARRNARKAVVDTSSDKHHEKSAHSKIDSFALLVAIGNSVPPNHHPRIPHTLSSECRRILRMCFEYDYRKRPTVEQLLSLPYFSVDEGSFWALFSPGTIIEDSIPSLPMKSSQNSNHHNGSTPTTTTGTVQHHSAAADPGTRERSPSVGKNVTTTASPITPKSYPLEPWAEYQFALHQYILQ